ncbi:MAG: TM2 domain-containing protein [Bacteroidia bacterium]|nr:TM2 domain-containing protein [Bacteroidia bacterium]
MKKSIKITLLLSVFSLSVFAAQPYKVKKCKHKMAQSPRVIVADNHAKVLPTVKPVNEIKEVVEAKPVILKTVNATPKPATVSDLSLTSDNYVPTKKQLKKAKRLQKRLNKTSDDFPISNNQVIAIALCFFFLFIHRIYLGYYGIAILQLLTLGGFGIWWLIDLIRLFTGDLKPKNGDYEFTI